jgi:hypothetical protein
MRWISSRDNNKNRSSSNGIEYNYIDAISENRIEIDNYGKHEFEHYFYDLDDN